MYRLYRRPAQRLHRRFEAFRPDFIVTGPVHSKATPQPIYLS